MTADHAGQTSEQPYDVEVQETRIFATGLGVRWWDTFVTAHRGTDRITVVDITPQGAVCRVACDSKEHAAWLRDQLAEHGLPAAALKVVTR